MKTKAEITTVYEYAIIGAGPAGIAAVLRLLENQVPPSKILWIDENSFKVGAFGTIWKNVPGNTTVGGYRKVYRESFAILEKYTSATRPKFAIDDMKEDFVCELSAAAEPLQWITDRLLTLIPHISGIATHINQGLHGLEVGTVGKKDEYHQTKRAVVTIGATPRSLQLPSKFDDKLLPLDMAVDLNKLTDFFKNNPEKLARVAIVGSSHTAYLIATLIFQVADILKLKKDQVGVTVFANKEVEYAMPVKDKDGNMRILNDNTGLKGPTAEATKKLIVAGKSGDKNFRIIMQNADENNLAPYSIIFSAIGFKAAATIKMFGVCSSEIQYDTNTTQVKINGKNIEGVFVAGIGHPLKVKDISGQITNNVGVTKFWPDLSKRVLAIWESNPAPKQKIAANRELFLADKHGKEATNEHSFSLPQVTIRASL